MFLGVFSGDLGL